MMDLALRNTRKYVGTYAHLDDWTSIGSFDVAESSSKILDDEDPCEPTEITLLVDVDADEGTTDADIKQALSASLSRSGCAHEHDCCGCVSTYVVSATRLEGGRWQVEQRASRNY